MRRKVWLLCLVVFWIAGASPAVVGAALPRGETISRLLVRFHDPALAPPEMPSAALLRQLGGAVSRPLRYVRPMSGGAHVLGLSAAVPLAEATALGNTLRGLAAVEWAEPDRWVYPTVAPNDPRYPDQWALSDPTGGMNLPAAWDLGTGDPGVVVGVLDSGVGFELADGTHQPHPDLVGRVLPGYDMLADFARYANDGDGRDPAPWDPGTWVGTNFCVGGNTAANSTWHGTFVAGLIGAATDNGVGIAGVNGRSRILPVRVIGTCGATLSDLIDGMRWAVGLPLQYPVRGAVPNNPYPADVVNLSLANAGICDVLIQQAVDDVRATGAVIVAGAGNSDSDITSTTLLNGTWPANCNGVIAVGATGKTGTRASYSNWGAAIDVSAPGGSNANPLLSTSNTGTTVPVDPTYKNWSGTSFSSAHVSGVASLVLSANPDLTNDQVEAILKTTARPFAPGACTAGDGNCGAGIVDAAAAVQAALAAAVPAPLTFAAGVAYPLAGPGAGDSLVAADSDGDCDPDLVVSRDENIESDTPSLRIVANDGLGGFAGVALGAGRLVSDLALADLSGDGVPDLVAVDSYPRNTVPVGPCLNAEPRVAVYLGNGLGGFSAFPDACLAAGNRPRAVTTGDFDGDGAVDLLVTNAPASVQPGTTGDALFYAGNGDGTFAPAAVAFTQRGHDVEAADLDGDGVLDVAVGGDSGAWVYLGAGNGTFGSGVRTYFGLAEKLAVGDVDGDGLRDLAVVGSSPTTTADDQVHVVRNLGGGAFAVVGAYPTGVHPVDVQLADLDRDGRADVVVANHNSGDLTVYRGAAGATLVAPQTLAAGNSPRALLARDVNGDGYPDLVAADRNLDANNEPQDGSLTVLLQQVAAPLAVDTRFLGTAEVGTPYGQCLRALGGTPPYSWSFTSGTLPAGLAVTPATGRVAGTPAAGTTGQYPVVAQVVDGTAGAATTSLNLTVTGTNQSPLAVADGATVNEGSTVAVLDSSASSVLTNDTDADGGSLAAELLLPPAHGSVSLAWDGTFSYTHDGGETATDVFTYRVGDGLAASAPAMVSIAVTPVNDPPTAVADAAAVANGGTVDIPVLANDSDPEGGTLTPVVDLSPAHGTATVNPDGTVTYTHDGTTTTADSFVYHVNDGQLDSTAVLVSVAVGAANGPPTPADDTLALLEAGTATSLAGGAASVLANDTDPDGDTLTVVLLTGPAHAAAFTLNPDGTFSYQHDGIQPAVAINTDSFTYTVSDGLHPPVAATVTVNVTAVDDPPVLIGDVATTAAGTSVVIDVVANDTDEETGVDPTTVLVLPGAPANGVTSVNPVSGTITYTPNGGFVGTDFFFYLARDTTGTLATGAGLVIVEVTSTDRTVNVPVRAGWNLLSFPVGSCYYLQGTTPPAAAMLPTGSAPCAAVAALESVFPGVANKVLQLRSFDAAGAHNYDPALPAELNDLTWISGGYGYWVKLAGTVTAGTTVAFTGPALTPADTLAVGTGWNLVGYWGNGARYVTTDPVAAGVAFPAGTAATQVAAPDRFPGVAGNLQAARSFDAAGAHTDPLTAGTQLEYAGPGYGYWLKLGSGGTLDYALP